jgi:ABC-2 type transporter
VRFETGVLGIVAFLAMAAFWSLAIAGFGYAIALKTGNPATVQSSFLLFFPFLFLTTTYVPRQALEPWLDTVAGFNLVTYLLEGLRSLVMVGWQWATWGRRRWPSASSAVSACRCASRPSGSAPIEADHLTATQRGVVRFNPRQRSQFGRPARMSAVGRPACTQFRAVRAGGQRRSRSQQFSRRCRTLW